MIQLCGLREIKSLRIGNTHSSKIITNNESNLKLTVDAGFNQQMSFVVLQ
jgi:hypothetical protein